MSRRGRRVPEAAPLLGVVLALGVAGFGFRFAPPGSRLAVAAVALVLLYGLTAYGVARSPDPAGALPPDAILAGGTLVAGLLAGYGVVAGQPMTGLLVAVIAAGPTAAYHARYGEQINPLTPDQTFVVAIAIAVGVAAAGVLAGAPAVGVAAAGLLALAAADYRDVRGGRLPRLAEFTLVAATFGGSVLAVGYAVVSGRSTVGVLAAGALLALGAYVALGHKRAGRQAR